MRSYKGLTPVPGVLVVSPGDRVLAPTTHSWYGSIIEYDGRKAWQVWLGDELVVLVPEDAVLGRFENEDAESKGNR